MKIESLTDEQKKLLEVYRNKWTSIGLSTEPSNKIEAEKAIIESYRLAGLKPPKKIVWCGSPLSQGLVRAIILNNEAIKASVGDFVLDSVGDSVWDSVRASVGDFVGSSLGFPVRASVRDSVWDSVRDSVGASVWAFVRDSVLASVRDSVLASVEDPVWASVGDSVGASVGDPVWDSVRDSMGAPVRVSVWDSVGAFVRDSVGDSARASVRDSVGASVWASVWDSGYGQHDAAGLGFYEYFREILGLKNETDKISGLIKIAKNAGWYLPHANICWISERHCLLNRDSNGRLHSMNEPAVLYPDGWEIYAVHGVRVPAFIIQNPEKITVENIEKENNTEVRRVMIDQYDREFKGRYIIDSGAKLISSEFLNGREYKLYKKEIENDEPMIMVKCINATAEPDGHFKEYFIRVHPECRPLLKDGLGNPQALTAINAVASTFGKYGYEYVPNIET